MYNMFSTDYYQLIFLFTFESANMVAKAKQKIGSKTTRSLAFWFRGEALRYTLSGRMQLYVSLIVIGVVMVTAWLLRRPW